MITSLVATIQTAARPQAGTDDRVWLDVGGAMFELRKAGANVFEPGQADAFVLPLPAPGLPASDVWRLMLCKSPDRDAAGWSLSGVTLVDQNGKVLYARAGLDAHLDASTGRQWTAPDFTGAKAPSTFTIGAEALRTLLEPELQAGIHGDMGPLQDTRPKGALTLACECDGLRISQVVRGRIAATDIDVAVSAGLVPFVVHATGSSPARLEIAIRGLHIDIRIPTWMHILTMGVTGLVEVALEKSLPAKLRATLASQLGTRMTELGLDVQHVDRLALRPGAIEVIMERQPRPEPLRPFPLRWV